MNRITLSLFRGYADTCPVETTLSEIVRIIREDSSVRDRTEKHRYYLSQGNTKAASREKASCPCFAVAVRFRGGKQLAHICGWTGLGMVDIDHIPADRLAEVREKVVSDAHTHLCYTTVSGQGLRILYRLNLPEGFGESSEAVSAYRNTFLSVCRYYTALTGCECDLACKNATRLSGLAHDSEVYFHPEATAFEIEKVQEGAKKRNYRLERAVTLAGRRLRKEGIEFVPGHHNEYVMRMGYLFNEYGIPIEESVEWAKVKFAAYDGDIEAIFRSCYADESKFGKKQLNPDRENGKSMRPKYASVREIECFLDGQASFRHNIITGYCECLPRNAEEGTEYVELTDRYVNSLWRRMCNEGMTVNLNDLRNVLQSEYVRPYNPFEEYFSALLEWDGTTDHIRLLTDTVHVCRGEQEVFAEYFKKWLVAAVASLLDAATINHVILVLVGPQGCYKTTWLSRLLPENLQRYFHIKSNYNRVTKDDLFGLSEFALVCLEEIDEMKPSELSRLKAMSTMPHISERQAYGHFKEFRTHISSFCGTTNKMQFLNDPTGERRWLPFEVAEIDNPFLHPVDYEGIYAQAYALWKGGYRFWFTEQEIETVNRRNVEFKTPDLENDLIFTCFRCPLPGEECDFVTVADVLARIGGGLKNPLSPTKVGIIMRKAGFQPVRIGNKRGYRAVVLSEEEIRRNRKAMARYTAPLPEDEEKDLFD